MSTYEELKKFCMKYCFNKITANYTICTETDYADCTMYPKKILDLEYLVPVTVFLVVIFLTGLLGNICVCTVIVKHPAMRTETNVYLFSLAVSDILLLIFGLIPELWYYWQMYPYELGEVTCRLTKFLASTATWASALTVVAFSIERYTAICHHARFRTRDRRRVAMAIIAIWTISVGVALPVAHVYHVQTSSVVVYPGTGKAPLLTRTCRIPRNNEYKYYNHLYFATSVLLLMLMYIKIALYISAHQRQAKLSGIRSKFSEDNKVFKVLAAVVLAFFVCGAPFHYQRLSVIYGSNDMRDPNYQMKVLVFTALFYYLSATINPILYNAMSKRYRKSFKEVISRTRRSQDAPMTTIMTKVNDTTYKCNTGTSNAGSDHEGN